MCFSVRFVLLAVHWVWHWCCCCCCVRRPMSAEILRITCHWSDDRMSVAGWCYYCNMV